MFLFVETIPGQRAKNVRLQKFRGLWLPFDNFISVRFVFLKEKLEKKMFVFFLFLKCYLNSVLQKVSYNKALQKLNINFGAPVLSVSWVTEKRVALEHFFRI